MERLWRDGVKRLCARGLDPSERSRLHCQATVKPRDREEGSGANGRYRVCGELAAVGRVALAFPAVCAAGAATAADTAAAEEEEKREKLSNFMAGMLA